MYEKKPPNKTSLFKGGNYTGGNTGVFTGGNTGVLIGGNTGVVSGGNTGGMTGGVVPGGSYSGKNIPFTSYEIHIIVCCL